MQVPRERQFHILIVDDVVANVKYLGSLLAQNERYEVEFATSGEDALGWACDRDFDLILLDVMMPGIDGFEVCRRLKDSKATHDIPVIFLTARTDTESMVHGFKAGGVDYITKPFDPLELSVRVGTHLELKAVKDTQQELIQELQTALREIKQLSGLLPICAYCKKIRDDDGYWQQLEKYIHDRSDADFSHGICPECLKQHMPDYAYDEE